MDGRLPGKAAPSGDAGLCPSPGPSPGGPAPEYDAGVHPSLGPSPGVAAFDYDAGVRPSLAHHQGQDPPPQYGAGCVLPCTHRHRQQPPIMMQGSVCACLENRADPLGLKTKRELRRSLLRSVGLHP